MRLPSLLAGACFVWPSLCAGMPTLELQTLDCAAAPSIHLSDVVSLDCAGDFVLSDGSVVAESQITIRSSGSLTLENLTLSAPTVELRAGTSLYLGSAVAFYASLGLTLTGGSGPGLSTVPAQTTPPSDIHIGAGGSHSQPGVIGLMSMAPEPHSYLSMLVGLLVAFIAMTVRRRQTA